MMPGNQGIGSRWWEGIGWWEGINPIPAWGISLLYYFPQQPNEAGRGQSRGKQGKGGLTAIPEPSRRGSGGWGTGRSGTAQPLSAPPRTTSAASPLPSPSAPPLLGLPLPLLPSRRRRPLRAGSWEAVAEEEEEQEAAPATGRLCLPPPSLLCPLLDERGRRRISKQVSTRNSRAAPAKQHQQWAGRWWYATGMWGQPHVCQGCQRESAALSRERRYQ
jgi:hypothetical protein